MLDLGLSLEVLKRELGKLHVGGYRLETTRVDKRGLQATQFKVMLQQSDDEHLADHDHDHHEHEHPHPHRALGYFGLD